MELRRYSVEYFSSLDWAWIHHQEILAENEAQLRAWIDRQCPAGYRARPYRPAKEPRQDTLKIVDHGPVELPYICYHE